MTLKFISLFSGAGGLDIGLGQAGWDCAYASDIDPKVVATLESNTTQGRYLSECFVERADVRELIANEVMSKAGVGRGEIRLLAGGPPCQSWSSAGHQLGFSDPRGQLFHDYVRLANDLDVEWLLFENVRGLLTARGSDGQPGSALKTIREALLNAGFQTSVHLINAADFGVPQRRVRLFVIGHRAGSTFREPIPTHSKEPDMVSCALRWKTLGECLSEVEPIREDEIIKPTGKLAVDLDVVE